MAELALNDIVSAWTTRHDDTGFLPRQPALFHHGCEFEYQVMDRKNPEKPFDYVALLPELAKLGPDWHLVPDVESGAPEGVRHHGIFITRDAARSMCEIVLPKHTRLEDTENDLRILKTVRELCWERGGVMLPYGTHPFMPQGVWNPGRRYRLLQEILGNSIHDVTRGTAAQVHIEVGRARALRLTNMLNALSGVIVILFANSPIDKNGEFSGHLSRRQSFYGSFAPDRGGMPAQPFRDAEAYVRRMVERTFLVGWRDGRYGIPQLRKGEIVFGEKLRGEPITFREFLETQDDSAAQVEAFLQQEPYNAGTWWDNARPRRKYGTVESRSADTQPYEATMAVPALNVGLAQNLEAAERIVRQAAWHDWVELHNDAIRLGFRSYFLGHPAQQSGGIVEQVLACAEEGLRSRNMGEEKYLEPLWRRLRSGTSPANEALKKYRKPSGSPEKFLKYLQRYET